MKLIIIGAVAGGTSAAAKARRNDPDAEIIIYEKDQDISYSGCSLPYFIGGRIKSLMDVAPRRPDFFKSKYNVDVKIRHEVLDLNLSEKAVLVKNLETGQTFTDHYDKLIIATGAKVFVPPIKGLEKEHVFFLRNVQNAIQIKEFIDQNKPQSAVIIGSGFVGFEVLENLMERNIPTTMVERASKLTPNLDADMSDYLEKKMTERDLCFIKNANVVEIVDDGILLESGQKISAEMVLVATGVKAEVELAKKAGIFLGSTGAIKVDERMMTIDTDVYACGDCIETWSVLTKKPHFRPLGSTANKTGRICGDNITGGNVLYPGNLGTGIFKFMDLTIASTGLSESEAKQMGYDIIVVHDLKPDRPASSGGKEMMIKAIADRQSQTILGVQIVGHQGVDKRLDVFVSLITYQVKISEIFHLDLAYSPPYSTAKDPVHFIGMILDNQLNH
jgi:NADPH-dependent 2,4-dienoyl-CoA reductase/sulfur reductase-like enzyme